MSAACLSAVLCTAASVSLASTFSRATPAALSRSAARMDASARRHGNTASTSSLRAAAASIGEQTRDSEPDEDVSILYHAAESVGPAHEHSQTIDCQRGRHPVEQSETAHRDGAP